MHRISTAARWVLEAVKAAFRMRWGGPRGWSWSGSTWGGPWGAPWTPTTARGDVRASSVVFACVAWMARTFPEAPLRVQQKRGGDLVPQPEHPLTALVATPNPYYAGLLLWQATIADWVYAGNAYWAKIRGGDGRPTRLWWLPAACVEPRWDDALSYIDYYDYTVDGQTVRLDPQDVVHFRYGLDPENVRKGTSPLRAVLREVLTDEEAAAFSSALLKNVGVPGVVLAPDPSAAQVGPPLTLEEAEIVKGDFVAKFGGDRRGEPLVLGRPMRVSTLSFSPDQMDLGRLRELPEERISAAIGIPAGVVGLGAGLARNTYANYAEGRLAAYESNLIPTQRLFAAEITTQLLPDFGDAARYVVDFDLSGVRILQPDLDALWRRVDVAVQGGWAMVDEARERVGLPPLPDGQGQVLYVKATNVPTAPEALVPEEAPAPPAPTPLALPTANVRAAPAPQAARWRPEVKALDGLASSIRRLRDRLAPGCTRVVGSFLSAQADRVARAATTTVSGAPPRPPKAAASGGSRADDVDWEAEARRLAAVLEPWFRRGAEGTAALSADALGVDAPLGEPEVAALLDAAAQRIVGITETTRQAVASALAEGTAAGEGVGQLAARIRSLAAFSPSRAHMIATTELATVTNQSAVASYRASGLVVGVRILDGPDCGLHDHGEAPFADGMVVPLERMGEIPVIAHPHCVRALAPVLDAAELEGAA